MQACLEKFVAYASPRNITLVPETYGFYEVRHGNVKRVLGAVKAENEDGVTGWVVNWADKKRKFVADSDNSVIVGRKVSANECQKAHKAKKPVLAIGDDEEDYI